MVILCSGWVQFVQLFIGRATGQATGCCFRIAVLGMDVVLLCLRFFDGDADGGTDATAKGTTDRSAGHGPVGEEVQQEENAASNET